MEIDVLNALRHAGVAYGIREKEIAQYLDV
jgi:uncharacterized protein (DUF342 family)